MENSKIGWTHHTKNFWWGCDKVSPECKNCYIESIIKRANQEPFKGPIRLKSFYKDVEKWNKAAINHRLRIFTCSMSDFFHEGADSWREEAWKIIKSCTNLDWLILTKRADLIKDRLPNDWNEGWNNVWLGVTVGCNSSKWRLDYLKDIPAKIKWVSAEPLLEDVDFSNHLNWIDWIVTGCEQANKDNRIKMKIDWVRNVNKQCQDFNKAHYFKQYYKLDDNGEEYGTPCTDGLLDGVVVQNFPMVQL